MTMILLIIIANVLFFLKSFIDNLDRIAADDYIPTCQDILRVRVSTTGILEYTFSLQKIILR